MKRILLMITAVLLTSMLLLGNPSVASHNDKMTNENEQFTSRAGDEAYLEDAGDCPEQVSGEQHCVVLYGHVFDLLNAVPINIQRPSPDCKTLARGFSGNPPLQDFWDFATQPLYSSPGFVEYKDGSCEDPRIHPERGLSSDVNVAQDVPVTGYWYFSADQLEVSPVGVGTGPDSQTPSMGIMPCFTVRMELWTERFVGTGEELASGQTTKTVVSSPYGQGVQEDTGVDQPPCPAGDADGTIVAEEVSEIKVDMGAISREIREHEGFVIGVSWFMHDGGDPSYTSGNNVYHREWNMHTGQDYPNRIVLAVEDSVRVEKVEPQVFDGKIYIHSVLNSPWGSYDVDTENILVEVLNENGEIIADQGSEHMEPPILRYSVDHDGHFKPVNATFPWDFKKEGLQPGDYTIRVTATNWQHTSDASAEGSFTIGDDLNVEGAYDNTGQRSGGDGPAKVEDSPGVSLVLAALAAVVLAGIVSLRRRQ